MKKLLLIVFLYSNFINAQQLAVDNTSKVTIENGASINISGLKLAPSSTYDITGEITISKSETPVTTSNGTSIDRVYNSSTAINNFSGEITFFYEDSELNNTSANEADLKLEVKETPSGLWTPYTGTINQTLNSISFTFSSINFNSITAVDDGATLSIQDLETVFGKVSIYPNPTTSLLKIDSDKNLTFELYDLMGKQILKTKNHTINLTHLPNAVYLLKVNNEDLKISKSYKIVKE